MKHVPDFAAGLVAVHHRHQYLRLAIHRRLAYRGHSYTHSKYTPDATTHAHRRGSVRRKEMSGVSVSSSVFRHQYRYIDVSIYMNRRRRKDFMPALQGGEQYPSYVQIQPFVFRRGPEKQDTDWYEHQTLLVDFLTSDSLEYPTFRKRPQRELTVVVGIIETRSKGEEHRN